MAGACSTSVMVVNSASAACGGKIAPLRREARRHHERTRALHRDWIGLQPLQLEELAVPVELRPALEQLRPDLPPFEAVLVAPVLVDGDAVQVELLLVPAADDVEAGAAVLMWSMVASALAPKAGVTSGTWMVENTQMRLVSAAMAALCVMVSNERP